MVVSSLSDIFASYIDALRKEFSTYCAVSVRVQSHLDDHRRGFDRLIEEKVTDVMHKGLPFLAYVIVPVQRVARYPLLLQVITSSPLGFPCDLHLTPVRIINLVDFQLRFF